MTTYVGHESSPSFSPDGSQVTFSWTGEADTNSDIYVKLVGTSSDSPVRLTTDPSRDYCPRWSPDGKSIAFLRDSGEPGSRTKVMLVPALGGPERPILETAGLDAYWNRVGESDFASQPNSELAWTPDGKWLVLPGRTENRGPARLMLASVERDETRWIAQPPLGAVGDGSPAFSPNGRTLAFVRRLGFASGHDIFVIEFSEDWNPVGASRRLTSFSRSINSPAWTTDGRHVLFLGQSEVGRQGLWAVSAQGGEARLLRPETRLHSLAMVNSLTAAARQSSEGLRLAYAIYSENGDIWEIVVEGEDAGQAKPVRATPASERVPRFSPDGRKIAFLSNASGSFELWVCDRDGSNALQLSSLGSPRAAFPAWSPNGKQIAFQSRPQGQGDIYVIDAEGGKPSLLTTETADDDHPTWSRDGKWIYFASNRTGDFAIWRMAADGSGATQMTTSHGSKPVESWDSMTL